MEDDDKMKGEASDNDWKVVSLTESAYASEPGPVFPVKTDGNGDDDLITQEPEFSQSLFMSGHFVFPPNEHENLPLNSYEVQHESEAEGKLVYPLVVEVGSEKTQDEIWGLKSISESSDQHHVGDQDVNLVEDKQEMYNEPRFSSFSTNVGIIGPDGFDDKIHVEPDDLSSPHNLEFSSKDPESPKKAALMGIVIIGHRWQQERWKIHQFKLKLLNDDLFFDVSSNGPAYVGLILGSSI